MVVEIRSFRGFFLASYLTQFKICLKLDTYICILQLRSERIQIQELHNKTMEERNDVNRVKWTPLLLKKNFLRVKFKAELWLQEVQTGNMTELYAERDLIMKSLRQFVNINFCVEFLNVT